MSPSNRSHTAANAASSQSAAVSLRADVVPSWIATVVLAWGLTWAALPAWSELVPPSDNIEQLVWSQGLELGYHKHPPMPTWILIGASHLVPASVALTYVLSMLGMVVGGWFLWLLSADLLGRRAAWAVTLATGCIAFYSYRAHIYNHNTVLVPFVYAAAWFFLRAVRTGRLGYWALLGVASAAAMLTKYQFAIVLATFGLIALALRLYRNPAALRGALLAAVVTVALLAPHLWWLQTNDFLPFRYASTMVLTRLGPMQRLDISGGFLLQQIRDALSPVLMLALAWWFSRRWLRKTEVAGEGATEPAGEIPSADTRVWVWMLGLAPYALLLILGFVGGARLENHWGTTGMQFVALPMVAWMAGRRRVPAIPAALVAFVLVQAAEIGYVVVSDLQERNATLEGGRVRAFNPASLSKVVVSSWREATAAPLRYVVGPTMWAGYVSVYSDEHPQVLIDGDPRAAPWVSMADVARCGAVYMDPVQVPSGAAVVSRGSFFTIDNSNAHRGEPLRVSWSIVPPGKDCR